MIHKAGFVSIIGKPNVGKSTLLNSLLGENLSIVTPKAQTTRHRIKGIYSDDHHQVVFSDTPGLLDPRYLMQEKMMDFVTASLEDADLVLYVTEAREYKADSPTLDRLRAIRSPVIVVLNKADQSDQAAIEAAVDWWKSNYSPYAIVPVAATEKFNTVALLELVKEALPESPAYYDKEDLSDLNQRFFASEIIREKIFIHFQEEIPYAAEVVITSYADTEDEVRISADIIVERDSQKAILIGKGGEGIKRIGTEARKHLQRFLGKHVYLSLFAKVEKDWRRKIAFLKRFGYTQ